jgi:alpha-amylase/alpha-mannosidase (GH57 family)
MATDEGVLGRSLGINFSRDGYGHLNSDLAHRLYTIYRYENADTRMNLLFRDHTLSDLIGFVYSGMPPQDAANNLIHKIKESAKPVLASGQDAVVPIILDGENAWEYYPRSGREFLRRFYDALQKDPGMEAVTVTEAIARHKNASRSEVAGAGVVDQRELQCLDWSAGGQQGLGLFVSRAQFLCPGGAGRNRRNSATWRLKRS